VPIKLEIATGDGNVKGSPTGDDNEIIRADGNTNRQIQGSPLIIEDSGNIDTKTVSTFSIGGTNADVVNIGRTGATVNIFGDTNSIQTTDLEVTDSKITLNKNGPVGSAANSGIEFEENAVITGFIQTSATRDSYQLKAPATAGIVTILPAATNYTIDETIVKGPTSGTDNRLLRSDGTTGRLIQESGITLDDSDNMSGLNSVSTGDLTVTGTTTLNTSLSGVVKAVSGVISASLITNADVDAAAAIAYSKLNLTDSIVNADVNASAAIAYSKLNLAGSIVDSDINAAAAISLTKLASLTADRVLVSSAGGVITPSTVTSAELGTLSGISGDIQTQLDAKLDDFSSSNDNRLVRTDGTAGEAVQESLVIVDDAGAMSGVTQLDVDNLRLDGNTISSTDVNGNLNLTPNGTGQVITPANVYVGSSTKDASAVVQIDSTTQGAALPRMTTGQRDLIASPIEGLEIYNITTKKKNVYNGTIWEEVGSGGGAGGINYIDNPNAEVDTSNWFTFDDGGSYVDGTGGTAANTTFTRNTTDALRDDADFSVVIAAADASGEGVSTDFVVDKTDQAKILRVSFDYTTDAPDGFFAVKIYDRTNGEIISVISEDLKATAVNGRFISEFQTAIDSTDYRLSIVVNDTDATGYSLNFVNVQLGPRELARGPIITDVETFTPIWTNMPALSINEGKSWIVGDTRHYSISVLATGAGSAAPIALTLPFGENMDVSKIPSGATPTAGESGNLGFGMWFDSGTSFRMLTVTNSNTTNQIAFSQSDNTSIGFFFGSNLANGDRINLKFHVPILGKSSNVDFSSDFGVRVIATSLNKSANQTIATSVATQVTFDGVEFDKAGNADLANNRLLINESGQYIVSGNVSYVGNNNGIRTAQVRVNGVLSFRNVVQLAATIAGLNNSCPFNVVLDLEKGDYVELWTVQTSGGNLDVQNDGNGTRFELTKIQSPQTLAGGEVVAMSYNSNSGQAVITGNTIVYEDLDYDTHKAYNTSTGEYTVPVSGKYIVHAQIQTGNVTPGASTQQIQIRGVQSGSKNITKRMGSDVSGSTSTREFFVNGSASFDCRKGDVLRVIFTEDLPAVNLVAVSFANNISITKIS
jgi:hypothetical protein